LNALPASPPISVEVDGGIVPAWTAGAGGPALIFLHGWSLDHRIWRPQLDDPALAARCHMVAIDRRGFGTATVPFDLSREPADIVALMDRLAIDRAVVIGQSQGGRSALRFAIEHGDRTAGLVLVGSPVGGFLPLPRPEEDVPVAQFRALVADGRLDELKRRWAAHPLITTGQADPALTAEILRDYDGRDLLAPLPLPGPDIGELGAIDTPALVVTGDQDMAWRRLVGDAMAYALPRSQRAGIPAAGHLCNADAPGAFNGLLRAFVAGLEDRAANP
jgi:pimeloyl-ACP methyl ester carboxylesterase